MERRGQPGGPKAPRGAGRVHPVTGRGMPGELSAKGEKSVKSQWREAGRRSTQRPKSDKEGAGREGEPGGASSQNAADGNAGAVPVDLDRQLRERVRVGQNGVKSVQ